MWRLMYAMVVVSNTGSVAIDSHHTDWPTERACQTAVQELYNAPSTSTINGVTLTIKTKAQCIPVGEVLVDAPASYSDPPPRYAPPPFAAPPFQRPSNPGGVGFFIR